MKSRFEAAVTETTNAVDMPLGADPLGAFTERATARAYLWSIGEYPDLPAAVDPLQLDATRDGLASLIGRDAVQQILSDAFAPYRETAS
jgi:hypothetical protein